MTALIQAVINSPWPVTGLCSLSLLEKLLERGNEGALETVHWVPSRARTQVCARKERQNAHLHLPGVWKQLALQEDVTRGINLPGQWKGPDGHTWQVRESTALSEKATVHSVTT